MSWKQDIMGIFKKVKIKESPPEKKSCRSCRWMYWDDSRYINYPNYWRCSSPENRKPTSLAKLAVDLSQYEPIHAYCWQCKEDTSACGPSSTWWEWNKWYKQ